MAQVKTKPVQAVPRHRVLREVFRHYLEFRQYVSDHGKHVIEHGYYLYDEDGNHILNEDGTKQKVMVTISFWDLFNGLKELSPRKREAVWYNVILDQKQHVVAKRMEITTVSVGQYVEQAMLQLSKRYFADEEDEDVEE